MDKKEKGLFTNQELMSIERALMGTPSQVGLVNRGNIHTMHATNRNITNVKAALKPVRQLFQDEECVKYHLDMQGYMNGIEAVLRSADKGIFLISKLDSTPKLKEFKDALMAVDDIKELVKLGDEGEKDNNLLKSAMDSIEEMCTQEIDAFREDFSDEGEKRLEEIMGEKNPLFVPFKYNPDKCPDTLRREKDSQEDGDRLDAWFSMLMSDFERAEEMK